ncbi:selenocysteine-specific translation elongation factor [Pseudomonas aeruginosa]|nr:selenocysteine-specific translation elongation factor [Pseudomonas aeruginosa]
MIVGTAGHIDHGKTSLLRALTGIEGDRRPAERQRGITIDLGYLYADLGDGSPTGFIDVPGHERFVHNMLAGASGIDCVLLVVAADDGLMPQTREHLAIVELLGIRRALVALTKIDRVEPQRVQQVRTQVEHLAGLRPAGASPIFPLSSSTGEGVAALREALGGLAGEVRERSREGYFRLAVDRAFSVAGSGIVVTGTAFSGQVAVGDELLLGNAGRPVRVRGLHAQNRPAQQAWAGQRVALNIAGERLALEQIQRGDWLLQAALHAPTTRVDIDFRLLPDELRDFTHWTPVHLHLGTQDVTGRLALLEGEQLEPGHRAFAQLVLNAPIQALHGDRLVLRDQSAQRTLQRRAGARRRRAGAQPTNAGTSGTAPGAAPGKPGGGAADLARRGRERPRPATPGAILQPPARALAAAGRGGRGADPPRPPVVRRGALVRPGRATARRPAALPRRATGRTRSRPRPPASLRPAAAGAAGVHRLARGRPGRRRRAQQRALAAPARP